jgi:hypothetical protein
MPDASAFGSFARYCERLPRKRMIVLRVFSSSTPRNSILVPGNNFFGAVMNLSIVASFQTILDFRRSSEYSNPATEAAFRPNYTIEVQRLPVNVGLPSLFVVVARRAGRLEKPSSFRKILRLRLIPLVKNGCKEDRDLKDRCSEHGRIAAHHSNPLIRR